MIVKGTTPTILYTFSKINHLTITDGVFVMKQGCKTVIEIPLEDATVDSDGVSFTLTQEQSLKLASGQKARYMFDYMIGSTRAQTNVTDEYIGEEGADYVI